MEKKTCLKCGHEWSGWVEKPKTCPKCKSSTWWRKENFRVCEIPGCGRGHKSKGLCKKHYSLLVRYKSEMDSMTFLDRGYHFFDDRGEFHIAVPDHGQVTTRKVIFDLEDKELIMSHKWCLQSRWKTEAITEINGWIFRMSSVVLGLDHPDTKVIHKNGDLIDNRKANLQLE